MKNLEYVSIRWKNDSLHILDQRKLPNEETYIIAQTSEDIFHAIKDMVVRGAPLIGFTGIFGILFWVKDVFSSEEELNQISKYLNSSRPTAINLSFELDNAVSLVKNAIKKDKTQEETMQLILDHAMAQIDKIRIDNQKMADLAADHLYKLYGEKKLNIVTLCNTGFLACGPMGTALGVISNLSKLNRVNMVYTSETRPYLQGSRLTSYELKKEGIDHRIIVEGAHSYILENKQIDAVFIGADRIVSNGDTANKIGSSTLCLIAKHYNVPFFVVAPTSSFDLSLETGDDIEIELRDEDEILRYKEYLIAPKGATAINPSFDISRGEYIRAIFCEKGDISPVTNEKISIVHAASNE
ncbi:MAG: S-methyl-5-thioribose-1-phosphate isomerase [Bacteriovoracaceae bacterium]|jgi:methylthioribose-1-phosphate isomerase|nr:S-methyl-5-thioribose-1-phosphate isomerase [Bacteriovoracaceae bacterium]